MVWTLLGDILRFNNYSLAAVNTKKYWIACIFNSPRISPPLQDIEYHVFRDSTGSPLKGLHLNLLLRLRLSLLMPLTHSPWTLPLRSLPLFWPVPKEDSVTGLFPFVLSWISDYDNPSATESLQNLKTSLFLLLNKVIIFRLYTFALGFPRSYLLYLID